MLGGKIMKKLKKSLNTSGAIISAFCFCGCGCECRYYEISANERSEAKYYNNAWDAQ